MSKLPDPTATREVIDEPPPFLGRWWRVYAGVLSFLLTLIVLFWLFERVFTP